MNSSEIQALINRGEDGKNQFKSDIHNVHALAAEMVAFSNSGGGKIFIGVNDDGELAGLKLNDVGRINQHISNAASQSVRPPINPQTENVSFAAGLLIVLSIPPGISKPYMDHSGSIWVKSGADKRKVTSREELQRMFQSVGLIHGDVIPANGMKINDLDMDYFQRFFEKQYSELLSEQDLSLSLLLENMNLAKNEELNITGALLFAKKPQQHLPVFMIKAVSYPGNDIHVSEYRDSQDIRGKIEEVFHDALHFIMRNLHRVQREQNVNSLGELEIPKTALEELLVNALIHRDYFISAPVRVFIFDDRIEIISPGHLPNNLTIEQIKRGNSNIRNPVLASFATQILPYRGLGNGVRRALKEYPDIDFENDSEGNQFKVTLQRFGSKREKS